MYAWTSVVVTKPSGIAIIAVGFAEYVTAPFYPGCSAPQNIQKCASAFCLSMYFFRFDLLALLNLDILMVFFIAKLIRKLMKKVRVVV